MGTLEFVYTEVLKPRPLKWLVNKIICAVLPRTVQYGAVRVVLNRRDPVVSGALTFRVYERNELAFVAQELRPGMTVLDVGANIGLYTALFAHAVGPEGRVTAFEPDPETFGFLQATIRENGFQNVAAVQMAASDRAGVERLYTSTSNRGDSRLYENELSDGSVEIQTVRLDDELTARGVQTLDFIKIDVQGFEGQVLAGLEQTIRRSPRVVLLAEFWPEGLQRVGTDAVALLEQLEGWGLKLYSLGPAGETKPIADKAAFVAAWRGRTYTNIAGRKLT